MAIKFSGEKALIGAACKKFGISVLAYPLSVRNHKKSFAVYFTLVLFGEKENKKKFFSFLRKSKRIYGAERYDDLIFGQIKEKSYAAPVYKHSVFHKEPIRVSKDGTEVWTVASFKREDLTDLIDVLERFFNAEILKIVELKASNLSILTICPDLTQNQKKAIELAINNGYYNSPRKIEVKDLAKMMNLSYATYHVHLRKAEKKLIPFFFDKA